MLELLCAGGGKPYYAKSGPGPKTLQAGSEQAGYFGTLTQAQLFTAAEIFNQVGISTIGPNTNTSTLWGKFFYKQKVVYIPTRPINVTAQLFSWQDLYQRGLVYGTDDNGTYPMPVDKPYNQRTILSKVLESKAAGFRIRLPAASDLDPNTAALAGASKQGELVELMANILKTGVDAGTSKWDTLDQTVFDTANSAIMKTTVSPGLTGLMVGKGAGAGLYGYSTSGKTIQQNSWMWWPILQYMNPDEELIDLSDFGTSSPPPMPVDVTPVFTPSTGGLTSVRDVTASLMARTDVTATTKTLLPLTGFTTNTAAPQPYVTNVSGVPVTSPYSFITQVLSEQPIASAVVSPFYVPFAVTVSEEPPSSTDIKLL